MVVANSSTLFMFGGSDGITDYANLWAFDLDGKSWQLLSPDTSEYKPTGRSHMVALMLDQRRILFVGGVSQSIPQIQSFIYNTALNKYQLDSHLNLPEGTQGMAGFAYNQSSYENACAYGAAPICSPINQTAVVIYGGSKPGTGVSGTMLIAFPNPEIMPKPPMEITFTIKTIGITIASIGIVFCAAMSIVLTVFHKHPAFKSASIMFLSFYLLGAVVALTGMIIYSKQEVKASSCTAALFTFSTGCSILYSSIFLKNLRIILIFRVKGSSLKRYLGDTYFGPALLVLVLINIGVLIGFVVNAPYKVATRLPYYSYFLT
ncbi:hypothetical protein BC830DRAFT_567243 [Chytriomyces sp. MP71]|nr:hypothetical protein BC830DRAFT_567243 [Chytriomyces sp. MP71]